MLDAVSSGAQRLRVFDGGGNPLKDMRVYIFGEGTPPSAYKHRITECISTLYLAWGRHLVDRGKGRRPRQ